MRILFKDLPHDARVLCVGAGTGAEILALAQHFPQWTFLAVDPSEAMLEVCRQRTEKAGLQSRCDFHHGYLSSLQRVEKFDAATAILVSQFLPERNARIDFFQEISQRLKPKAYLVNADLCSPATPELYDSLIETWNQALRFAGIPEERVKLATSAWRKEVAVSKPEEIESIISEAGLVTPTLFYQTLFIRAWYSKVVSTNR